MTGNEILLSELPKDSTKYNQWLSCQAFILNDSLTISSGLGFFAGMGILVSVSKKTSKGNYFQYEDVNLIYRKSLQDKKSKSINVKAQKIDVILNDYPQKITEMLFGKITFVTTPFFIDDNEFKKGYLKVRETVEILFSCTPVRLRDHNKKL